MKIHNLHFLILIKLYYIHLWTVFLNQDFSNGVYSLITLFDAVSWGKYAYFECLLGKR